MTHPKEEELGKRYEIVCKMYEAKKISPAIIKMERKKSAHEMDAGIEWRETSGKAISEYNVPFRIFILIMYAQRGSI